MPEFAPRSWVGSVIRWNTKEYIRYNNTWPRRIFNSDLPENIPICYDKKISQKAATRPIKKETRWFSGMTDATYLILRSSSVQCWQHTHDSTILIPYLISNIPELNVIKNEVFLVLPLLFITFSFNFIRKAQKKKCLVAESVMEAKALIESEN